MDVSKVKEECYSTSYKLANNGYCVSGGAAAVVFRSSWVEFLSETIFNIFTKILMK